ncbi:type 2 isopentenyl-diphosphate Delta-isomerase [bacterium]|nr:type 2 isopentenyl-diphosphate Delta-isomerase [bacterium]
MSKDKTSQRKKDHIELCQNDDVKYKIKTAGFENYDFVHYAITEVKFDKITLATKFLNKKISFPFLISCMTGGTHAAQKINEKLAIAAKILNIPLGIGSQRQALENNNYHSTYRAVRKNAGDVPILGNIGAAQLAKSQNPVDEIKFLVELADADAMVVHVNPLQELVQKEGEPEFDGLLKNLSKVCRGTSIPVIVKEVGSGISKRAAKNILETGVYGIDVAGAGGTSWAKVEMKRNNEIDPFFQEWGLPTAFCVRKVHELKKNYNFVLIASGGIENGADIAKSIALGADLTASARPILQELQTNDIDGVVKLIENWFLVVKKIMYLTGCDKIKKLQKTELLRREDIF